MSKSKNYENWLKKNYPRKCERCDYISNNPSMHYYHKKTHQIIPDNKLCDHGCGYSAKFIGTSGKYTCKKIAHQCPNYIQKHSKKISEQWQGNIQRRENARKTFFTYCCGVKQVLEKQKNTLKEKWGDFTPEQMKDYRHYARRVRVRAQKWAKSQNIILGKQTYHVDHKLSIWDAWKAGLSEEIVNHPANLQIIEAKLNCKKGAKSLLTAEELLSIINN